MKAHFPITTTKLLTAFMVISLIGLTAEATVFAQAFAPPVNYTVGSSPYACALGDLNGDGKQDIAVANNSSKNISVLAGNGDGTFGARTDYDVGLNAYGVVLTDLNGDSKLDMVAAASFSLSSGVSVLLGNGDGTFQSRVDYPFSGLAQPNSILASDFNNDGKSDVVVVNMSGATVFLGNGDGTLGPAASYGSSNFATSVAVGDFNVDGKVDLAVSSYGSGTDGVVSVMLGIGDGTFSPAVNYASAPSPFALVKGDFNGDGKIDLATANIQVDNCSVLLGNGDGTFQAFVNYTTGSSPYGLSIGDLNSDGKSDLVVARNGGGLSVLKGNGDGSFQKSVNFQAGGFFASVFDLNGDGKPDIISAGQTANSVGVFVNQTGPYSISGTVRDSNSVPLSGVTVRLTGGTPIVVDTDATGTYAFNDLTAGQTYTVTPTKTNYTFAPLNQTFNNLSSNMSVDFVGTLNTYSISGTVRDISGNEMAGVTMTLSGSMSGTMVTGSDGRYSFTNLTAGGNYTVTPSLPKFMFSPPLSTANNLSSNRVINFTAIVATYTISGGVTNVDTGFSSIDNFRILLTGTRTGTTVTSSSGYSFSGLPVDGDYTVTAYSAGPNSLFTNYLLLPPPNRSFTDLSSNVTANFSAKRLGFSTGDLNPLGIARGDLNGDGKLDVAVATTTGNSIHVLLGNGDGTLQSQVGYTADSNPAGIVVADFDGDGKADVASANIFGSNVSVFIGNGDGTLKTRVNYAVGSQPSNLSVGDFNSDGKNDLAVLGSPNTLSILLGNGNGTFQPAITRTVATAVFSVLPGDFNADGKPDLVTLGFPTNILVLLGRGDGTFDDAVSYPAVAGAEVVKATVADLNSDGKLDVAVASRLSSKLSVLLGNGNGTFQAGITTALLTDPADLISHDFDGDTRLDLAVAGSGGGSMFLSGLGDGTFSPAVFYQAGSHSGSLVAGDFNNDGKLDFALTSQGNEVNVLLNASLTRTPALQLDSASYSVNEGNPRVNITVTRTGDTSGSNSVKFTTNDAAGLQNCNVFNGIASPRCDFIVQIGTVSFAAGETSKSFSIAINNDSYAEGTENFTVTLSNPVGAAMGAQTNATVMIVDNESTTGPNPIDETGFFVRQQYLDFLGREPDPPGFAGWVNTINNCPPNDTTCDRVHVSQLFFQSAEFQQRGYFVYRFYPVSFGRKPDYDEFVPDLASVSGFLDDLQLEAAKVAFIAGFMERPAFVSAYNSLNNTQYVDTLLNTAGVTPASRLQMIDGLNARTLTRAQVLRQIAESNEVATKYFNQAYAVMEYFGYLRRQPDALYLDWIAYLNGGGTPRGMVTGFVNSAEYQQRFGP